MNDLEKKLWIKTRRFVGILRVVPFIRMVAVCNNLAFGKIDEKSDIDLFIIAKSGRLFTVRILVTLILHILGVRRHGSKIAGRFCLSFFVDDDFLDLSKIALQNDIYLAFWIKSMIPLIDDGISEKFLIINSWAREYFESEDDFVIDKSHVLAGKNFLKKNFERIFDGKFGNWFEMEMKKWQLKRANKKAENVDTGASLLIGNHILKFHNVDRRAEYRNKWVSQFGEAAKLKDESFLNL